MVRQKKGGWGKDHKSAPRRPRTKTCYQNKSFFEKQVGLHLNSPAAVTLTAVTLAAVTLAAVMMAAVTLAAVMLAAMALAAVALSVQAVHRVAELATL